MMNDYSIYFITDDTKSDDEVLDDVAIACENGVTCIQYRTKQDDLVNITQVAKKIRNITSSHNVTFIVNDYYDIAKIVDADGVHIGQDDDPIEEVRKHIGDGMVIGTSVGDLVELENTNIEKVDYIGIGSVFDTSSKSDAGNAIGVEGFKSVAEQVIIPAIAIGGINDKNITSLSNSYCGGVAIISHFSKSKDMAKSIQNIKKLFEGIK